EIQQEVAVPIKEMNAVVLAKVKVRRNPVYCRLVEPASLITRVPATQSLHQRDSLLVRRNISIYFCRASSQAPARRPVLDRIGQIVAASKGTQQEGDTDKAQAFDENAAINRAVGIEVFNFRGARGF